MYFMGHKYATLIEMDFDESKDMKSLIESGHSEIELNAAFEILAEAREENVWLANFFSDNTRDNYRRAVVSFVATLGLKAADDLYEVKPAHVIAWRTAMEAQGLANATIAARLSALSSLYKQLADAQLVPANPVTAVRRPKSAVGGVGAGKSPTLTKKQVRQLLDAPDTTTLKGLRDRAILHLWCYEGMRCSEPARCRVKDFFVDDEYHRLVITYKGNKQGTITINPETARCIREYLEAAEHGHDAQAHLFQPVKQGKHVSGSPLSRKQLYRIFTHWVAKSGIGVAAFPHTARATMITTAAKDGELDHIRRHVGHSSITTTEMYVHAEEQKKDSPSLKLSF